MKPMTFIPFEEMDWDGTTLEERRHLRKMHRIDQMRLYRTVQKKRDFQFGMGFMNGMIIWSMVFIMLFIWTAIPAFMISVGVMMLGVLIFENFIFERSKIMQFIKEYLGITALKYKMQAMADYFKLDYKFVPAHGEYSKKKK